MSEIRMKPHLRPHPNRRFRTCRLVEGKRNNGLGVAALVVGIVAAVFSVIPLVGMIAFFLGPVAIILGIIAFLLKNRKRGMAIAGTILGIVSLIVAGIMAAAIGAAAKAVDESINAEHTVEYVITTSGPATVSYWTGSGSSTEKVTADWKKSITSKDLNITSLSVMGDFSECHRCCQLRNHGRREERRKEHWKRCRRQRFVFGKHLVEVDPVTRDYAPQTKRLSAFPSGTRTAFFACPAAVLPAAAGFGRRQSLGVTVHTSPRSLVAWGDHSAFVCSYGPAVSAMLGRARFVTALGVPPIR